MTLRGSILLVDDEEKILKTLGRALRDAGLEVVESRSPRDAQRMLAERSFDVLLVDNVMPQLNGLDLIREYVASTPEGDRPQILMMTAHATVESAIEAMKLGALDYLQKPFEIDELLVVVRRAIDHQRLRGEYRYLRSERDEQFDNYGIIGSGRLMAEIIDRVERVAETKSTVLITGETGTGKELVARAIHNRSAQRDQPLIQRELRGDSRVAARIGAVRPRARRLHRRGHVEEGQVRAGRRRHHLPGRDRHDEPDAPVEAAAGAAGARVRAARLGADRKARRPRDRRHQPRPPADGRRGQVPGRPVLPVERHSDRASAAARSPR